MHGIRKWLSSLATLALLLAGAVASAPEYGALNAQERPPTMRVEVTTSAIRITAAIASDTHADGLERLVDLHFPDHDTVLFWQPALAANADWQLLTFAALEMLAETSVVRLDMTPESLKVDGLRPAKGLFDVRLQRVAATGGPGFETSVAVAAIDATTAPATGNTACRTMFGNIDGEPIRFFIGTSDLRPSSLPLLDRYAEFSSDCPLTRLAIIGHTDSSGDEAFNRLLSEDRARVVAEYLVRAGIERDRVRAVGMGSDEPLADNGTAWGRGQNRRIEIRLEE